MATDTAASPLGPVLDVASLATRLAVFPAIVGLQLAAFADGRVVTSSAGVTDQDDPFPVGDETRFRPGSITKVVTATLVMQCVDDGLVSLDDAVATTVPEVQIDPRVKVRHLIGHSSGIDAGDLFVDTGPGDDAIDRYAALLAGVPQLFAPGATFSYNNAGFVLAGLIVQRLRDSSWDDAVRTRVLEPLGMTATTFEDGITADARGPSRTHARGHLVTPSGVVAIPFGTLRDDPMCTRGLAPAGATLVSTATDLARLGASLAGSPEVPTVVSPASAAVMCDLQSPAPGGVTRMAGVGFAWQLWHAGERLLPRIGGANPGQSGVLAIDPLTHTAVAALSNSDQGVNMVTAAIDGFGPAATPADEPAPSDLTGYTGTYTSHALSLVVETDGAGLTVRVGETTEVRWGATQGAALSAMGIKDAEQIAKMTFPLTPVDRTTFSSPLGPLAFLDLEGEGRPQLVRVRMRALRRTE